MCALGGGCAHLLLSAPHTVLRLEKLPAVFSVTEFSVTEGMSPADPHGIPGNMREGPSVPSLEGGNTSLKAQVPRESCPGQAGPLCFLWSPAGQCRRDPGGLLGLETASPPGCSLLSHSAPLRPPRARAGPPSPPSLASPSSSRASGWVLLITSSGSLSLISAPKGAATPLLSPPLFITI